MAGFFKKKARTADPDDPSSWGAGPEFQQSIDSAYRSGRPDPADEENARAILEISEKAGGRRAAKEAPGAAPESLSERMARLERLKAEGIITEQEFEQIKQDLQ